MRGDEESHDAASYPHPRGRRGPGGGVPERRMGRRGHHSASATIDEEANEAPRGIASIARVWQALSPH